MKFAFKKAAPGNVWDKLIGWYDCGPYAHVECILAENADGTYTIASSVPGTGVRTATNQALPLADWDIVEVEDGDVEAATTWFKEHAGQPYYYKGLLGFAWRPIAHGSRHKWFCSDACLMAAFNMAGSWRVTPNCMYDVITKI